MSSANTTPLRVKRLSEAATMPVRKSPSAAGFDLSSAENVVIKAKDKGVVKTDLEIACPPGTYGRVAPRSGLAAKKFIDVGAGVVDADYRGNIGVVLFNFGESNFEIKVGYRIAQLVLAKICSAPAVEVDELDDTERGAEGFGSSGVAFSNEAVKAIESTPVTKRNMGNDDHDGESDDNKRRTVTPEQQWFREASDRTKQNPQIASVPL